MNAWRNAGVGLVIVQAVEPAASWAPRTQFVDQVRVLSEAGMPWDAYIYDYLGDPAWFDRCLALMDQAAAEGHLPRQVWLDEEDVETERGWPAAWRIEAIQRSVDRARAWCGAHGVSDRNVGIYTAAWWWVPNAENSAAFADLELWDADYDGDPNADAGWQPYGGWGERRIKQYAGSTTFKAIGGIDMNGLSGAEESELSEQDEQPSGVAIPQQYLDRGWNTPDAVWINLEGIIADLLSRLSDIRERASV